MSVYQPEHRTVFVNHEIFLHDIWAPARKAFCFVSWIMTLWDMFLVFTVCFYVLFMKPVKTAFQYLFIKIHDRRLYPPVNDPTSFSALKLWKRFKRRKAFLDLWSIREITFCSRFACVSVKKSVSYDVKKRELLFFSFLFHFDRRGFQFFYIALVTVFHRSISY